MSADPSGEGRRIEEGGCFPDLERGVIARLPETLTREAGSCAHGAAACVEVCGEGRCAACYGEELETEEYRPAPRLDPLPLYVDNRGTISLTKTEFNREIGDTP